MLAIRFILSLIILAKLGLAQPKVNLDSIVAEAATFARTADTWSVEGTRSIKSADGRAEPTQQFRIDFHQTDPVGARLELTGGENPLIRICDGSSQWTYYPKTNQHIRVALNQFNPCAYPLNAWPGLSLMLRSATQVGTAQVTLDGRPTECQVLRESKQVPPKESSRTEEICLDPRTKLVLRFHRELALPTGGTRTWTFSSIKRNVELEKNLFSFRPPVGSRDIGIINWLEPGIQPSSNAVRASNDVPPPGLVSAVAPESNQPGASGMVVLTAEVNADGIAQNIKVLRSLSNLRDDQAIEAVKKWSFEQRDYNPLVSIITAIGVNF